MQGFFLVHFGRIIKMLTSRLKQPKRNPSVTLRGTFCESARDTHGINTYLPVPSSLSITCQRAKVPYDIWQAWAVEEVEGKLSVHMTNYTGFMLACSFLMLSLVLIVSVLPGKVWLSSNASVDCFLLVFWAETDASWQRTDGKRDSLPSAKLFKFPKQELEAALRGWDLPLAVPHTSQELHPGDGRPLWWAAKSPDMLIRGQGRCANCTWPMYLREHWETDCETVGWTSLPGPIITPCARRPWNHSQ